MIDFLFSRYEAYVVLTLLPAFILLGLTPRNAVMSVFSNLAPITIAAMFILSGALVQDRRAGSCFQKASFSASARERF